MWRLNSALLTTANAGAVYFGAALAASLAMIWFGDHVWSDVVVAAPPLAAGALLLLMYRSARQRLRRGARQLQTLQRDHDQLLAGLDDGVFMLDEALRIAAPCSPAAAKLLGRAAPVGDEFLRWLDDSVAPDEPNEAQRYLRLLFGERVNEKLVSALNPLSELRIDGGRGETRWLRFRFDRVRRDGRVVRLRVIVRDVSVEVAQRHRLTELNTQLTLQKVIQTRARLALDESERGDRGGTPDYEQTLTRLIDPGQDAG